MTQNTIQLPKRSEVQAAQTWDLTDLYADFGSWEQAVTELPSPAQVEKELATRFRGRLGESPQILFDALQFRDSLFRKLTNLGTYAGLRNAEDVGDSLSSVAQSRMSTSSSLYASVFSFMQPEISNIANLSKWIAAEPLKTYGFELSEILRAKEHLLSEKEEVLLALLSDPLSKFSEIHSKWNNVDLKFAPAKDANGEEHLVTHGRLGTNLSSKDRTLRENTHTSFYNEISKWRNTITANFTAHLQTGSTVARIRNFKSFREAELHSDNIPVKVYDALIEQTRKNLAPLHKSMALRKRLLKIDAVAPFDRMVSIAPTPPLTFTWEEACELILKSLAPMGSEYLDVAEKALTKERWADYAENEGKRSGAFSWGTYDSRPYLLISWTGSIDNLFTLAHELGHSMHTYYANKSQPYHLAHYPIFLAEIASTLNETLLGRYVLENMPGSDLAKAVVSHNIQGFEGTVLRQTLFACFERDMSAKIDAGEPLTPDALDEHYLNITKEWYGDSCSYPAYMAYEWMRISHFYNTFYVYKYATSYCASLALAEGIRENPTKGAQRVVKFLSLGGSQPPLQTMLEAGIDFLKPDTVKNAFAAYERDIIAAQKLFEDVK